MKSNLNIGLILCIIVFFTPIFGVSEVYAEEDSSVWFKNIDTASDMLKDITYGNNMYVAVGEEGTIKTSYDGKKWESRYSTVDEMLITVTWNGKIFVAGGEAGTILISEDGVKWEKHILPVSGRVEDIEWGENKFIAVCLSDTSTIYTSEDGINWSLEKNSTNSLKAIEYNGKIYVAVGYEGIISTSVDGKTWVVTKESEKYASNFNDIIWNGSFFVAVGTNGTIATSYDGIEWAIGYCDKSVDIQHITWDGKEFVAIGRNGKIYTSPDALTWKIDSHMSDYTTLSSVVWTGDLFVIVGREIYTSPNGKDWTRINNGIKYTLNSIAYNNSLYIAVGGNGTILTSNNANDWVVQNSGTKEDLYKIIWNGYRFVAVGKKGVIITSFDGVDWYPVDSKTMGSLNSIVWNGSKFLAGGVNYDKHGDTNGVILESDEGVYWRVVNEENFKIHGIIWNGQEFAAYSGEVIPKREGGDPTTGHGVQTVFELKGKVYISTDGNKWTESNTIKMAVKNILWDGNQYIMVGGMGNGIYASSDGLEWLKYADVGYLNNVIWDGEQYLAVGNNIIMSGDAKTWTKETEPKGRELKDIIYDGKIYLAVGDNGVILIKYKENQNLALCKAVFSSSDEVSYLNAGNVVDGNSSTRWSSEYKDDSWIYVDLGQNYDFNKVLLKWEDAFGKAYKIQVSDDAQIWRDVYATTAGDGGVDDIVFNKVNARYVKMLGLERGTDYGYSLYEFKVYN